MSIEGLNVQEMEKPDSNVEHDIWAIVEIVEMPKFIRFITAICVSSFIDKEKKHGPTRYDVFLSGLRR